MMNLSAWEVGQNVLIQTVHSYFTGHICEVTGLEIILDKVSWIPDLGRHNEAMRTGVFAEVEPYPDDLRVPIPREQIVHGVCNWPHPLPREVK